MIRPLLLAGLIATTADAQRVADTVPKGKGELFVQRVVFSTTTSTLVSYIHFVFAAYGEPDIMIGAAGLYLSTVALTTAVVDDGHSGCRYGGRFNRSFAGGLIGLGVATVVLNSVRGTHMKGWSAVIPVSGILLSTPVAAAIGAGQCDRKPSGSRVL